MAPVRVSDLPFYSYYQEFLTVNAGKKIQLVIGIGTSGSRNVSDMMDFVNEAFSEKNVASFILLIDDVYTDKERRKNSIERILQMPDSMASNNPNFESTKYVADDDIIKIKNNKNFIYVWGVELQSNYTQHTANDNEIKLYAKARNHLNGPYEYGKDCKLSEENTELKKFYQRLLIFFKDTNIQNIYVYNQAWWMSTLWDYVRNSNTYYKGPLFDGKEKRLKKVPPPPPTHNGPRSSLEIMIGQYYEGFCEFLWCLWKSNKMVYKLLKEGIFLRTSEMFRRLPQYGGQRITKKNKRKQRKTRKA